MHAHPPEKTINDKAEQTQTIALTDNDVPPLLMVYPRQYSLRVSPAACIDTTLETEQLYAGRGWYHRAAQEVTGYHSW